MSPGNENVDVVLFVAIDFENLVDIKGGRTTKLNSQVGVAMLDTKLTSPRSWTAAMSTVKFVTGSPFYCAAASKKLLFGKALAIHQNDILSNLDALLVRKRKIVLVGHGFRPHLRVLQLLNLVMIISTSGILNAQKIAAEIMPYISFQLHSLPEELGCSYYELDYAGYVLYGLSYYWV